MAKILIFDARFTDDMGEGSIVDSSTLRVEFYEQGSITPKETRVLGNDRNTSIISVSDSDGVYYTTTVDVTDYIVGRVTAKWFAESNSTAVQPYPLIESLPYPTQSTLTGSELEDYIATELGYPSVAVELTSQHYSQIIDKTLAIYNEWLPAEQMIGIDLIPGVQEYYLPMIPSRGPSDVVFVRRDGVPFVNDPLFGRFFPRANMLDFDVYQLGIAFWETVNRTTGRELDWWWSQSDQTIYISTGESNVAGSFANLSVAIRYFDSVSLEGVKGQHFNWFRSMCCAQAKKLVGRIRNKFSGSIPAPGGRLTLDGKDMLEEGSEEESMLLEKIRSMGSKVPPMFG